MTVKGRTTQHWGRYGARWDSNPENGFRTRSYPARPEVEPAPDIITEDFAVLANRPGFAEPDLTLTLQHSGADKTLELVIQLCSWFKRELVLNERQSCFLRDRLNAWFPPE